MANELCLLVLYSFKVCQKFGEDEGMFIYVYPTITRVITQVVCFVLLICN